MRPIVPRVLACALCAAILAVLVLRDVSPHAKPHDVTGSVVTLLTDGAR